MRRSSFVWMISLWMACTGGGGGRFALAPTESPTSSTTSSIVDDDSGVVVETPTTGSGLTLQLASNCGASTPLLVELGGIEVDIGFEVCENGIVHRVRAVALAEAPPPGDCFLGTDDPYNSACYADSECTDGPDGRCLVRTCEDPGCGCTYGCRSDADCESGFYCDPFQRVGTCMPAGCMVDSDCATGELCRHAQHGPGSYIQTLQCTSSEDECGIGAPPLGYTCGWNRNHFEWVDPEEC